MPRALIAIATLALGGCSSLFDVPAASFDPADTPETYYRQLVMDNRLPTYFTNSEAGAQVMISGLRRSTPPQPGYWMTCLAAMIRGQPQYLAVFIRDRMIVESRSGILIDRCDAEQYVLLAAPNLAGANPGAVRAAAPSAPRLPGLY